MKKAVMFGMAAIIAVNLVGCGDMSESKTTSNYATDVAREAAAPAYAYDESYSSYESYDDYAANTSFEEASQSGTINNSNLESQSGRKLIKDVNMSIETTDFDTVMSLISDRTNTLGGYIENQYSYNGTYDENYGRYNGDYYRAYRYASLTIRIPSAKLDAFLTDVSTVGNVVNRTDNVEDVTLQYVDIESRKDTLKAEEKTLLSMMDQAVTIEEMLTIESYLTDIRYELESLERSLRSYDNQVDYSTVYLQVNEVKELTPVEVEEPTTWERMRDGFVDSLSGVGNFFKELGVWIISNLPVLILIAAIVCAIVLPLTVSKKAKKRRAARKEARKVRDAEIAAARNARNAMMNNMQYVQPVMPMVNAPVNPVSNQKAPEQVKADSAAKAEADNKKEK